MMADLSKICMVILVMVGMVSCDDTCQCGGPCDEDDNISKTRMFKRRAVASGNDICSEMGNNILRISKNTADAAITTLLCLGVTNSYSMGLGGGFLATLYDRESDTLECLNSREVAPLAATKDLFVNGTFSSIIGGKAIAVPGEIQGYAQLYLRYGGKLKWRNLFRPVIKMCLDGFEVSDQMAWIIKARESYIREDPGFSKIFLKKDGSLYGEGDIMTRPLLAETLQRISDNGPISPLDANLVDDIVADIKDLGGIISTIDFCAYRPVWKKPVSVTLDNGGYTVHGPPPPASAAVVGYILNILDGYNWGKNDQRSTSQKILDYHRTIEAMKFGYGKRSALGDEDKVDVQDLLEDLQSNTFADATRAKIKDDTVLSLDDYDHLFDLPEDGGTAHVSIIGQDGSVISVTSTINTFFGARVMGTRTGIIFNDEMDDFSTPGLVNNFGFVASKSNFIEPGKRPMSSMSPMLVEDANGHVVAAIGAAGGSKIISGITLGLVNNLWLGYDVGKSLDLPRYHHQLLPDQVDHDNGLPQAVIDGLKLKGHPTFKKRPCFLGTQVAISVINFARTFCYEDDAPKRCIAAASDYRRGKSAAPDGF